MEQSGGRRNALRFAGMRRVFSAKISRIRAKYLLSNPKVLQ